MIKKACKQLSYLLLYSVSDNTMCRNLTAHYQHTAKTYQLVLTVYDANLYKNN